MSTVLGGWARLGLVALFVTGVFLAASPRTHTATLYVWAALTLALAGVVLFA